MEDVGVEGAEPSPWKGRSVLLTGAAGLLGRRVGAQLADAGALVHGLDIAWDRLPDGLRPSGIDRIDGDVRDTDLVGRLVDGRAVDTVIHLAAQTLVGPAVLDPADTFSNNVHGTWAILDVSRIRPTVTSIVVASSDKAYGDWAGRPYREDMALRGRHPYDASKAASDLIAQSYAATYGMPIAITRCGNLYGGGDLNWSRVVPGTIRSVLEGEPPIIRSDGTYVRDYLHVEDGARGVVTLAGALRTNRDVRGQAFNFAAGVRASVLDVVDRVLALMESPLQPVVRGDELKEIAEQRVSAARAKRVLEWRPRFSLDEGLTEAIDWYRTNLWSVT